MFFKRLFSPESGAKSVKWSIACPPQANIMPDEKIDETEKPELEIEETIETEEEEVPEVKAKSPYEEELARIEAEAAEKVRIAEEKAAKADEDRLKLAEIKDRAIEKEKAKTKDTKDQWKTELREELRQERLLEKAEETINDQITDPAARKLALHHYKNSIVKTGNLAEDIEMAVAIVDRKRLSTLREMESLEDESIDITARSMGGDGVGTRSFQGPTSPAHRAAEQLSRAFAGGNKELAKKLAAKAKTRLR